MPAARDLTGQRFGRLTVVRPDGRVFWGRDQPAWLCRCDCGVEVRVPQKRLTNKLPSHQYHACDTCRSTPCEVCGAPVPREAKAKTCSPECRAERQRRYDLAYYHARSSDPAVREARLARAAARWAGLTPEEKLGISRARKASEDPDHVRERNRAWHQRQMAENPDYAARKTAARQRWLTENADAAREYQRTYAQLKRARRAEIEMMDVVEKLQGANDDE